MEDPYIPILMYHSISVSANPHFQRWAVAPDLFDEHLSYLSEHHFSPIAVTDLVKARTGTDLVLPERPVILTFDDAYADFYENAFPALLRHGFPATLYVPTAYVGGTCTWLHEEGETIRPMVSWSQLAEMSACGIECGAHSHNHVQMDAIPYAAADDQIRRSKALLEEHLGHEILSFAYPHGWANRAVKRMVRAAGYTSACAVKNMLSSSTDDPFEIARLVVTNSTSVTDLAHMLTHRMAPLEVAVRSIARPVVRFVPRSKAWLKSYPVHGANATATRPTDQPSQQQPEATRPMFEPAAMLDIDISCALPSSRHVNSETGEEYRRALVLARLHTHPLGVVELFADGTGISAEQLAGRIWETYSVKINQHLRDDGLPEVTGLSPAGLSSHGTPRCVAARQRFLTNAPFVSVLIPTHNRPEQVVALVHSVLASDYPAASYEVVVVDNAPSSNATAAAVEQHFGTTSQVRYVREDRPGTANARNLGLLCACGEFVVFADDDELVDEHWLTEMVRGFSVADDVACVSGLITPMESATPAQGWFEQFGGYCKEQCESRLFNLSDHRAESPLYPYNIGIFGTGGSMAFRRSILLGLGGFDTALGPATPTLGGEDIDAMLRIVLEGHALLYQPAAVAHHPPYREYAQLRRQIQGYGTGIAACLFKNVVTRPRLLPDFVGKLPRGLLFAFSSHSPHHAAKHADYPKELTWLELKGLLYGPLAYLLSRRLKTRVARPQVPGAYIEPVAVPAGESR